MSWVFYSNKTNNIRQDLVKAIVAIATIQPAAAGLQRVTSYRVLPGIVTLILLKYLFQIANTVVESNLAHVFGVGAVDYKLTS